MNPKIIIQLVIGVVFFCIWSAMAYYDASLRGDYSKFIISVVVGLVALILRDMPNNPPPKE